MGDFIDMQYAFLLESYHLDIQVLIVMKRCVCICVTVDSWSGGVLVAFKLLRERGESLISCIVDYFNQMPPPEGFSPRAVQRPQQ